MGTRCKCVYCGLETIRYNSQLSKQKTVCCSRKCFASIRKNIKRATFIPWNKGRINVYSDETLQLMSIKKLGRKCSIQTRLKMSKAHPSDKCNFWKGGINSLNTRIRKSFKSKLWKEQILKRDNYTCQSCSIYGVRFHIHHKVSFNILLNNFLKSNMHKSIDILVLLSQKYIPFWDIDNGTTLCIKCHKKTNSYLKYG